MSERVDWQIDELNVVCRSNEYRAQIHHIVEGRPLGIWWKRSKPHDIYGCLWGENGEHPDNLHLDLIPPEPPKLSKRAAAAKCLFVYVDACRDAKSSSTAAMAKALDYYEQLKRENKLADQ